MGHRLKSAMVLAVTIASVRSHLAWNNPELQPVQGLYVRPSSDGTTGDLYVAATEDSGVRSQWLTDQPVNFLPASQSKTSGLPLFASALSSNALPHDESVIATQKRAILPDSTGKFGYGLPSGTPATSYMPYAYAGMQSTRTEPATAKEGAIEAVSAPAAMPYSPYYMYPHMMHAAYASAMNVLKEAGQGSEDASNSNTITSYPTAMWPASYYPMQYVMMDPTAWAKSHAAALASATAATTNAPTTEATDDE